MIFILLMVSSFFIGWFAREMTLTALSQYSRRQQEVRLKNLVAKTGKPLPFQSFLLLIENNSYVFKKNEILKNYFLYLSRLLQRMGRNNLNPIQIFAYQILGSVGASILFGLLSGSIELSLIAFAIGAGLPVLWLRDKALSREKRLLRELPNALEILSLCSEAGLSLEQALDQYLKNAKKGPLWDELAGLLEQSRTGSSRKNALEAISSKLDLTDFSLFTTSLIQAERFGTGIAKTLRQLSITMRDKQSQRAEKAVQEMPVKMLLPLILFIMPVTFLIIFGPLVLQFLHQ